MGNFNSMGNFSLPGTSFHVFDIPLGQGLVSHLHVAASISYGEVDHVDQ